MPDFVFRFRPYKVSFGAGTIQDVPAELKRLGLAKALILCTPQQVSQASELRSLINAGGVRVMGTFSEAAMHTPIETTVKAVAMAKAVGCDVLVSIGGGSSIGIGKAISYRSGIFHLAIPTTYAGSEMTAVLGETVEKQKTTLINAKVLPGSVVYDVNLTMTLPVELSITSGINAIAHAVEALYAHDGNPIVTLLAREAIQALVDSLPQIKGNPASFEARSKALYGSWLCGTCLGNVSMALHHKLCHTLGGSFGLPHSETHTILLPHSLAYNAPRASAAMDILAEIFPHSQGDAVQGMNNFLQELGVVRDLAHYGFREEDIAKAAEIAASKPYPNPRTIEKEGLEKVLRRAWAGEDASVSL